MDEVIAGRYEVLAELGSGALGTVYRVRDRESGEERALKLLKEEAGGGTSIGRFEREFASVSKLDHPNIVKVHDFGRHGERLYFTMEILEGTELKPFCESHRPPAGSAAGFYEEYARKIAYVFYQVADALTAAHDAGLIHRDVKPDNIFVKAGRFPRAKLLDFGHARAEDARNLTRTGSILGTAFYIPPEQAMAGDIGPHSDLYSLGCVLFEALAGRPPYPGATVIEVLMGHIQKPVPNLAEVEPRVSPALVELVRRMMQKFPADRPGSAKDVAQVLSES